MAGRRNSAVARQRAGAARPPREGRSHGTVPFHAARIYGLTDRLVTFVLLTTAL